MGGWVLGRIQHPIPNNEDCSQALPYIQGIQACATKRPRSPQGALLTMISAKTTSLEGHGAQQTRKEQSA